VLASAPSNPTLVALSCGSASARTSASAIPVQVAVPVAGDGRARAALADAAGRARLAAQRAATVRGLAEDWLRWLWPAG
jgi:hypothetical protein